MVIPRPLRVVYFGTPEFAVPTLEAILRSRHAVVALVSQPDRPRGRGQRVQPTPTKVVASGHGVPVLQPVRLRDEALLAGLAGYQPDIGVVAAYGRLIPDALLALPTLGMINVHASLLPRWRGAAPVHRAVMAGDAETGVTIMRVVTELDAGPMFDVVRVPIAPDETSPELERRLAILGAERLVHVLDDIAAGRATETPQDHGRATYAPKITREDGQVDWTRSAREIHDQVRGAQPWPLVSVRIDGHRALLHRTAVVDDAAAAEPGTITAHAGDRLEIAAGRGAVRVLEIQPEGRRAMPARDFLAGRRIPAGARVTAG